jgi:hypothetical protein
MLDGYFNHPELAPIFTHLVVHSDRILKDFLDFHPFRAAPFQPKSLSTRFEILDAFLATFPDALPAARELLALCWLSAGLPPEKYGWKRIKIRDPKEWPHPIVGGKIIRLHEEVGPPLRIVEIETEWNAPELWNFPQSQARRDGQTIQVLYGRAGHLFGVSSITRAK